jgi:hypothetical protein
MPECEKNVWPSIMPVSERFVRPTMPRLRTIRVIHKYVCAKRMLKRETFAFGHAQSVGFRPILLQGPLSLLVLFTHSRLHRLPQKSRLEQEAHRPNPLGLGRLTRMVSQRRRGDLRNYLRSIKLDSEVIQGEPEDHSPCRNPTVTPLTVRRGRGKGLPRGPAGGGVHGLGQPPQRTVVPPTDGLAWHVLLQGEERSASLGPAAPPPHHTGSHVRTRRLVGRGT